MNRAASPFQELAARYAEAACAHKKPRPVFVLGRGEYTLRRCLARRDRIFNAVLFFCMEIVLLLLPGAPSGLPPGIVSLLHVKSRPFMMTGQKSSDQLGI